MRRDDTDELIQRLAANAQPVRPQRSPSTLALIWLAGAVLYVVIVVLALTPRSDVAAMLTDVRFLLEAAITLVAAGSAAVAAFTTTIPGYERRALVPWLLAPAVWIASMGAGCIADCIAAGDSAMGIGAGFRCFPAMLVAGAVPAVAIAILLRRGAPLTPSPTLAIGGLAAAAIADLGLRFHHVETGIALLVWHALAVGMLFAAAAIAGRAVLTWRATV